jgi:hypothetical protein
MKVTHVSLRPTDAANAAGRPALTPELLAATGARYSRSDDGLEAILAKIDPENPDKSVDSIFKMVDYGHQSIADMAPVALFMDGVSVFLAYLVWSLCPVAVDRSLPLGTFGWARKDLSTRKHSASRMTYAANGNRRWRTRSRRMRKPWRSGRASRTPIQTLLASRANY